ncbi:hypothetical protein ACNKU7_15480 [Microbulbifer sp. SA54]|uniref:hypothetical protein n=1 Tax=Microbulbifer sp. SA54 TaxID=3401577 RepID=UPI003AABB8D6
MRRYLAFLGYAALFSATSAVHGEQLTLEVRVDGHEYQATQPLGSEFEYFESGALTGRAGSVTRTYDAIRCDGPWGAMKYQVALPSGPGFILQTSGDKLLLRILEHRVLSEDRTIQAMKVHCQDLAPKMVVNAITEIEIQRGKPFTDEVHLDNGFQLALDYEP